jgi:predicted  nucleic acid-binding Zn-ribbon protein
MTDEIAALVQLKDVDARIGSLTGLIALVPEQIAELTRRVELMREDAGKKRTRQEELKVKRRSKEKEVEDFTAKIHKFEIDQYAVSDNKQYQALLREIALLKEKRSQVEGEIIEIMEQEENSVKELKEFEGKIAREEASAAEDKRRREAELERATRELAVVESERSALVSRLSSPVRARYERVSEGKGGMAVTSVKNRACATCCTNLPPQTLNEIRKGLQVITCETCGRLLVWTEESGQ